MLIRCVSVLTVLCSPALAVDLAVKNARVVVGNGEVIDNATVVVTGDRIEAVLPGDRDVDAAHKIDARGRTVMPGLMDTHVHLFSGLKGRGERAFRDELREDIPTILKEYLRHGVTTVKSTGDPLPLILELRKSLRDGVVPGPRLLAVGPGFTAPGGHPSVTILKGDRWWRSQHSVEVADPDTAKQEVRRVAKEGVDAIKVVFDGGPFTAGGDEFAKMSPEVMRVIIEEAHKQNLRVTVHTWREKDAIAAIEAGADGLEHGVAEAVLDDNRLCELLKDRNAVYVGTLGILRALGILDNGMHNLKRVVDNGGRVALGTDTFTSDVIKGLHPGLNTILELEHMADAGLSNAQIIAAATRNAAEHLGLPDLGTVEKGKIADLIVVDGDPLANISALRKLKIVIQGGRAVYAAQ